MQQCLMSGDNNTLFAVMRTGGDPHRAVRCPLATQRNRFCSKLWRHGNIKFQTAGDGELVIFRTQRDKTRAIFFILRRD